MAIDTKPRGFLFEEVRMTAPEMNGFDLSHERRMTVNAGELNVCEILECLPSDYFTIQVQQLVRPQPLIAPVMQRISVYHHYFFVPNRIVWKHWKEFISRGDGKVKMRDAKDYVPPEPPYITMRELVELSSTYLNNGGSLVKVTPRKAHQAKLPLVVDDASLSDIKISLLPFYALGRIYNEYYRDQNLTDEIDVELLEELDGHIDVSNAAIKAVLIQLFETHFRAWEKDYFTSALPEPQRGPDVLLPINISGTAPVLTDFNQTFGIASTNPDSFVGFPDRGNAGSVSHGHDFGSIISRDGRAYVTPTKFSQGNWYSQNYFGDAVGALAGLGSYVRPNSDNIQTGGNVSNSYTIAVGNGERSKDEYGVDRETYMTRYWNLPNLSEPLTVDGSNFQASSATIVQLRRAFALQRWFEKAARVGSRYNETVKGFFNIDTGDARINRPEYLGGFSSAITISEVLQTSETTDNSPQGNFSGHAISAIDSETISYRCVEHGFIFGILSVLPRTSYNQGVPRMFSRETWMDYPWPEFALIGEQEVRNKEIYLQSPVRLDNGNLLPRNPQSNPDGVFGYQSRYSEYKYLPDDSVGDFAYNLNYWTLGREFTSAPELSTPFIEAHASDRIFAVSELEYDEERTDDLIGQDDYLVDIWFDVKAVRPLPLFSDPALV